MHNPEDKMRRELMKEFEPEEQPQAGDLFDEESFTAIMDGEEEAQEMTEEEQEEQDEAILAIAYNILKTRDEAVQYRANSGIERWWKICEQMLDYCQDMDFAPSMMDYASGNVPLPSSGVRRSKVVMNLVRGRCEVTVGRFEDILLPVRGRNWGFKVTPNPMVMKMIGDNRPALMNSKALRQPNGDSLTADNIAHKVLEDAEKAMTRMERLIDDALTECNFNSEERKCMVNAVYLGTGILKGPTVSRKLKKIWEQTEAKNPDGSEQPVVVRTLNFIEDNKPVTISVSPWNVYPSPDCKGDPSKGSRMWEKDTIRPRDIQRLIGLPGYKTDQLEAVLKEQPKRLNTVYDDHGNYMKVQEEQLNMGDLYELWEYNGEVKREYMELLGCECPIGRPVSAKIVFINDKPVKADLNVLDTGDLPYDFFTWTDIPDIPWGAGEPIKVMWAQRIINAVWRQMCDNSGDSAGANLAIRGLEPDDGVWEISGKKLWRWDGETDIDDIRKAITQVQITNNQAPMESMMELAIRFMDLMTATPTIFQGETKEIPDTLGATNIVVDSSNVTFRSRVKRWDDTITIPHLRRWYDFMMQYHEDESAKGDFEVDPRGASVLYEKDQMRQQLVQIFQMKGDPDINRRTDWDKAIELFYSASHLEILKDVDNKEKEPPPSPDAIQLQIAQLRAEADLQVAQLRKQTSDQELAFRMEEAEKERAHKIEMQRMEYQMRMMDYSEKRNMNLDKLKVQLTLGAEGMNLQERLAGAPVKSPQVISPPTEPAGQAPVGEAYQR